MIAAKNTRFFSVLNFSIAALIQLIFFSCQDTAKQQEKTIKAEVKPVLAQIDTSDRQIKKIEKPKNAVKAKPKVYKKSDLVELSVLSADFEYDLRYATTNNTFKEKLYPCAKCLLRFEVAQALIKANKEFEQHGYHIKIFDGYRPLSVSRRMWEIIPNPAYVKNPNKGASMHNCGTAVDITLISAMGDDLDMGTDFDYFGRKAHHAYSKLPQQVIENRKLLKNVMEKAGFRSIRTEWWHYSFKKAYPPMDKPLPCSN